MRPRDSRGRCATEQREPELDLPAQQVENVCDAFLPVHRETPHHRAPDQDRAGSEAERLENIGAASNAAVEQNLRTPVDGVDDFLEHVEGRRHAVELAAAVVRDDDGRGAVLDREPRVFCGEEPLDDERQPVAGEPLEVAPAETRVELLAEDVAGDGEMLGRLEVDANVALAATEIRNVDGAARAR